MDNKEYFLLDDETLRTPNGGWKDEYEIIPAGTIVVNVRKENDHYLFTIKETGAEGYFYSPFNLIENTPENLQVLEQYNRKMDELMILGAELEALHNKFKIPE